MLARPLALALAGALLVSTSTAAAQDPGYPLYPIQPPRVPDAARYRNPRSRITGIALTAVSLAHLVAGVALLADGLRQPHCGSCDIPPGFFQLLSGSSVLGVGGALGVVGSVLWSTGARPPIATTSMAGGPAWAAAPTGPAPRMVGLRWTF